MHRGLPALQRWLVLVEVKFDTNTTGGSPSPKLDQHDPNTIISTKGRPGAVSEC
jgi:hypothetical protein